MTLFSAIASWGAVPEPMWHLPHGKISTWNAEGKVALYVFCWGTQMDGLHHVGSPPPCLAMVDANVSTGYMPTLHLSFTTMQLQEQSSISDLLPNHLISQPSWNLPLDQLDNFIFQLSPAMYSSLLQSCGRAKALLDVKRIHRHIVKCGLQKNLFLANRLGHVYVQCGAVQEAFVLFANIQERDVFSWNFLIRAYALDGQLSNAFQIFGQMQMDGVKPDRVTFVGILSAYSTQDALYEGKQVHVLSTKGGFESDILVGNSLLNMYGKCGSLEDAQKIFVQMSQRDVVSRNSMIVAYAKNGQANEAIYLCQQMQIDGTRPDRVTFISLLSACANQAALLEGMYVHDIIVAIGLEADVAVGNALINMYGKCGILVDAWIVFLKMKDRDIISWNAMLAAYANDGQSKKALQIFYQLQQEGSIPNKVTFVSMLNACACEGALAEGKRMHTRALSSTFQSDIVVESTLVHMYGKCGNFEDAWRAFCKMSERNLISWNTMIAVYDQHGQDKRALQLFHQMHCECIMPNIVSFVTIFSVCASQLAEGKHMHALIARNDFLLDVVIGTALVHMYGKFGLVEDASRIFGQMPGTNLVSWNAMITVFAQHGQCQTVFKLCNQMQQEGLVPDNITFVSILSACATQTALHMGEQIHACIVGSRFYSDVCVGNALINMYGKCGVLEDACHIFDSMPERNVVSWNAIIAASVQNGQGTVVLKVFYKMQREGVIPDKVTFINILDACTSQAALSEGKRLHTLFLASGLKLGVYIGSSLMNMYGKCGRVKDACGVFDTSPKQDVNTWNAMISVYAQNGQGKEALQLLVEMYLEGIRPDDVTFVSVLSGCSHTGLVDDGCHCFISMCQDHAVIPNVEHYNCMIDLLGRAGRLSEAEDLVWNMPFEPTVASLMTLLGACSHQVDLQRGERVANLVFKVDPGDPTPYVILSNIYAESGRERDAAIAINRMKNKYFTPQFAGCIKEVNNWMNMCLEV